MESVLLDAAVGSLSHRLLGYLDCADILALRRVCRQWKSVVETYPHLMTRFRIDCPIPADTNPLSPMDRISLAFAEEASAVANMREGVVRDEVVHGAEQVGPLRKALAVGYVLVLVGERKWGVWELKNDGGYHAIPHLVEEYDASFRALEWCVLRDRFLMLLLGGHFLSLDCGEVFDLPLVLRTRVPDGSSLVGAHETAVLSAEGEHLVYEHEEHPPFGFHAELARTLALPAAPLALVRRASALLLLHDGELQERSLADGSRLAASSLPPLPPLASAARVGSALRLVSRPDGHEALLLLHPESPRLAPDAFSGVDAAAPLVGRHVVHRLRDGVHHFHRAHSSEQLLVQPRESRFLGWCDSGRIGYFEDRLVYFGSEQLWFRRLEKTDKLLAFNRGLIVCQRHQDGVVHCVSYRDKRMLFE